MIYLASRRGLSADGRTFTTVPGTQTSFLRMNTPQQRGTPGHRIDSRVWAQEILSQSRNGEVLFVIHGFRIPQNEFLGEVAHVQTRLASRFRGAVIGLDWPTNGSFFDYVKDHRDARATAFPLMRDAVNALFAAKPTVKLHILSHSMGCHFVSVALQSALGTPLEPRLRSCLRTVSVTAPDVDQATSQAHHPFTRALERTCRSFVVHYSGHDEALHTAEDVYHQGRKRLGRDGFMPPASAVQSGVDWTQHYQNTYRNPFGVRHSHSWYYRDGTFYDQVVGTLQ